MKAVFEKNNLDIKASFSSTRLDFPPMFHNHAEIIYFLSGEADFMVDGNIQRMKSGDICFTFPYSIHEYKELYKCSTVIIMFKPELAGVFEETLLQNKPCTPFIGNGQRFMPLMSKIVKYSKEMDEISKKTLGAYLQALIGELIGQFELSPIKFADVQLVQKIFIYCSQNYKSNISVKKISDEIFVSSRYISKIFAENLNCSFRDYINQLRINEAKRLLLVKKNKIIDIMLECGFENQSSFNRVFYDVCGETPSQYRKRIFL